MEQCKLELKCFSDPGIPNGLFMTQQRTLFKSNYAAFCFIGFIGIDFGLLLP